MSYSQVEQWDRSGTGPLSHFQRHKHWAKGKSGTVEQKEEFKSLRVQEFKGEKQVEGGRLKVEGKTERQLEARSSGQKQKQKQKQKLANRPTG